MPEAIFRFYEELNDVLPEERKKKDFPVSFGPGSTVGDVIARLGIAPKDIDLILVNGVSVDFAHALGGGERVSVYPVFESLDIRRAARLGHKPLRDLKFVADNHLGRLARHMRLFGFDTFYNKDLSSGQLIELSEAQGRVLLTKNRRLLEKGRLTRVVVVEGADVKAQLNSIFQRLDLYGAARPFSRCMCCNATVEPVSRETVLHRLPEKVKAKRKTFFLCRSCNRVYWKGTHFDRMNGLVRAILG